MLSQHLCDLRCGDISAVAQIRALGEAGAWDVALAYMSTKPMTYSAIAAGIEAAAQCSQWSACVGLLACKSPALWTEREVTATLRAMRHRAAQSWMQWARAAVVFSVFTRHNPDGFTDVTGVNAVLEILARSQGSWVCAASVLPQFVRMKGGPGQLDADTRTVSAAVSALKGSWVHALLAVAGMTHTHLSLPSLSSQTATQIFKLCVQQHRWAEASSLVSAAYPNLAFPEELSLGFIKDLCRSGNSLLGSKLISMNLGRSSSPRLKSRALNILLQHSSCTAEALEHRRALEKDALPLEHSSLEKIVELRCADSDWFNALGMLSELIGCDGSYHPPARVHDCIQFAMSTAIPQPSWEISLRVFTAVSERTPLSEPAFQCALRTCFSQGVSEHAQRLLVFAIKRGVRK
jgi:hypothetical protein